MPEGMPQDLEKLTPEQIEEYKWQPGSMPFHEGACVYSECMPMGVRACVCVCLCVYAAV